MNIMDVFQEMVDITTPLYSPKQVCEILNVDLRFLNLYSRQWLPGGQPELPARKRGAASTWSRRDVLTMAVGIRLRSLRLSPAFVTETCRFFHELLIHDDQSSESTRFREYSSPSGCEILVEIDTEWIVNQLFPDEHREQGDIPCEDNPVNKS